MGRELFNLCVNVCLNKGEELKFLMGWVRGFFLRSGIADKAINSAFALRENNAMFFEWVYLKYAWKTLVCVMNRLRGHCQGNCSILLFCEIKIVLMQLHF